MQTRGKLDDTLAAMFSNIEYRDSYLFYAHMIGQCSIKIDNEMAAPAGVAFSVDHYNLYINPNLFDEYCLNERLAILKHEMLHILNRHVDRMEDRLHMAWNFATDCAINQMIDSDHLPERCVTPETLAKMMEQPIPYNNSSETYYDMILDKVKENIEKKQQGSEGEGGDPDEPQLMDSHDTWEQSTGDPELQRDMTKKMIEKSQEETIKGKGAVPAECSDWLELHTRRSQVNWKKILRGIVGNKRVGKRPTVMRQDRRFPTREDLRGKTRNRTFNLLVIADVSGSMTDDDLLSTLGEVQHICSVTKTNVDLIQVDSEAFPPEKLTAKTKTIQRKAAGGTYLNSALHMAKQHNLDYQAVVVLTDGGLWDDDIDYFEAINKRIIWLVCAGGQIHRRMNDKKMQACQLS